jgi:hypothetical protein
MKTDLLEKVITVLYNRLEDIQEVRDASEDEEARLYYGGKIDAFGEIIQLLVKGK